MAHDVQATLRGYCAHMKEKIDTCFTRGDDPDPKKRFARRGITREIFDEHRVFKLFERLYFDDNAIVDESANKWLRLIAHKVRGDKLSESFCNALATLIYMRCTEDSLKVYAHLLLHDKLPKSLADDGLHPLPEPRLIEIFGKDEGHNFWEQQCLFRPVILMINDEAVYEDGSSPLPFVEEPDPIGSGSFANVNKVKIETGHLIMDEATGSAYKSKYYAQKVFLDYQAEKKKSFETERAILKKFIQSSIRHDNILVTKASLEWNGTYSLFFDLAKYNLWDYFHDGKVLIAREDKASVFGRCIGLASALNFLHEELFLDSTNEQLRCYHLDLKPQNILVFEREEKHGRDGNDVWKISDFGISKIKHIKCRDNDGEPGNSVSFLDSIFRPRKPDADPSSGVDNSRYGGTYAAPEARLSTDKVTRKSDVWSLGCVFALVLTFLDNGSKGIKEFEEARIRGRDNDRFFESDVPMVGTEAIDVLHPSVGLWLDRLIASAKGRSEAEGTVVENISTYLQKKMLLTHPEKRDSAKDVERKMMGFHTYIKTSFEDVHKLASVAATESVSPVKRSHADTTSHIDLNPIHALHRIQGMISPEKKHHASGQSPEIWSFENKTKSKRCKLSHSGRYLTIESGDIISTLLISDVRKEQSTKNHTTPKDAKWILSSLGSEYLCAVPESEYFQCYYAALSSTDISKGGFLRTQIKMSIRKVAMSPSDEITAFVLEETISGRRFLRLALFRTSGILKSITQGPTSLATLSGNLPWADIIRNPHDAEIPATAGLIDLKFSGDSRTLITVTDAYKREPDQPLHYDITVWDVGSGHRISVFETKIENSTAIPTTIAPFTHSPSVATISNHKISISSTEHPHHQKHSHNISNDIKFLDLVIDEDHEELIILAQSVPTRQIKLYKIPMSNVDGLESVGEGMDTGLTGSSSSSVVFCWYASDGEQRRSVLVANVSMEGKGGLVAVVGLD
ncbi:hypothetical protein N7G274_009936 [Stereocaulon virgatum]|uniref:Protein kinase domain-containing protein n=1 Tax=Stereocaulon virgatum TaxID=373712 RepID=A0ABR3ZYT9_9LECA